MASGAQNCSRVHPLCNRVLESSVGVPNTVPMLSETRALLDKQGAHCRGNEWRCEGTYLAFQGVSRPLSLAWRVFVFSKRHGDCLFFFVIACICRLLSFRLTRLLRHCRP